MTDHALRLTGKGWRHSGGWTGRGGRRQIRVVACVLLGWLLPEALAVPASPGVSLRETVARTPFHDLDVDSQLDLRGRVTGVEARTVWLRVTDSLGRVATATVPTRGGEFRARFPGDFPGAGTLVPAVYFVDAAVRGDAGPGNRAEVAVLVFAGRGRRLPDLPSAFTTNLRDHEGRVDGQSSEWARTRTLVNLYFQSRSAYLAGVTRPGFDLQRPTDLAHFKRSVALYDFDARDRDWSTPLGRRVARSFWQAVWDTWFGPSNSSERPPGSGRYAAFTFANDTADLLVVHLRRLQLRPMTEQPAEDDLALVCNEVLRNLAALQRRDGDDAPQQRGVEGPGAFYYGLFSDGDLMLEGTGWFHDGRRRDHRRGGVFLGRSLWAVGEALGRPTPGMPEAQLRETLRLGLRWGFGLARDCADDGQPYVRVLPSRDGSRAAWRLWRSPGEHAYLLLGLLAAVQREEIARLTIFESGEFGYTERTDVAQVARAALEALAAAIQPEGYWSTFADVDATAVEALVRGSVVFAGHPSASHWRRVAVTAAEGWLSARPPAAAYRGSVILPAGRRVPGRPDELRYRAEGVEATHLTYFHAGLWMQALAELQAATGDARYSARLEEVAGYFCGNNPFDARLYTELGAVYNYVKDTDGDTVEDRLHFDLYPESTAFVQIGMLRHLELRTGLTGPSPISP